ncbi:MAG: helix-turn-helix domain-containing protein, partial [Alkalispirochaeta sp.]
LENVLRRAVVVMGMEETIIEPRHLPVLGGVGNGCHDAPAVADDRDPSPEVRTEGPALDQVVAAAEREHIARVLAQYQGNRTRSAGALGISVRTLQYKLRRYGIS